MKNKLNIEIVYAGVSEQRLLPIQVAVGSTVLQAIKASNIQHYFPEIEVLEDRVGIFGKIAALDTILKAGDRVEIYRPLLMDPKEARRLRAIKNFVPRVKKSNRTKD